MINIIYNYTEPDQATLFWLVHILVGGRTDKNQSNYTKSVILQYMILQSLFMVLHQATNSMLSYGQGRSMNYMQVVILVNQ